ncbi:GFA family protein [Sinorhizobium garamanticum]|uniref:GFA family protein n=1 Tax=Sinorhizobium garamanticum TaxID=680247 RepID=A0ABY8DAD5_9HYPH|nr:GFA family protein [Sinorhizobium garamanticum]WEX86918.1 GFA family protein [Sinorhizobium garamanticum]
MEVHEGGCLCGAVRFKTHGKLREIIFCHCSQCRKQTGLYYAATNVLNNDIDVEGADNVTWYRSSPEAQRGFCRHCGSALFWKADTLDYTSILAGTFETPTRLEPGYHIYCADKGDYYDIVDELPRFDQGRA